MTVAAPVVAAAPLVGRRPAGAYQVLSLAAPDIASTAVPGQFVSVGVDAPGTLLRRPVAIAGVDRDAGIVDLAVAVVGRGSAWLAARPVSSDVDVVGPLGHGFGTPDGHTRCVLVGGGYGVAALGWLAGHLVAAGHPVDLLSGAASVAALYPVPASVVAAVTLHEVTEDGSAGRRGLVTDALQDRLARPDAGSGTVFACGPMPMLAAVARLAAAHGWPCQVAVEEHMACTVGVCMTCVVPSVHGYQRACIEGPVMDAETVAWDVVLERCR